MAPETRKMSEDLSGITQAMHAKLREVLESQDYCSLLENIIKTCVETAQEKVTRELVKLQKHNLQLTSEIMELKKEVSELKTQQHTQTETQSINVDKHKTYTDKTKQKQNNSTHNKEQTPGPSSKQPGNTLASTPNVANTNKNNFSTELAQKPEQESDGFIVVRRKNRERKNAIIGTGSNSTDLKGASKKMWLFVGRIQPGTTEGQVITYLQAKIPLGEFSCEAIPTQGVNCCFKIGTNYEHHETLNDPNFWPNNTVVRRYTFRRSAPGQFNTN